MSHRIDALEETVAHQARALDEMSEEMRRQGELLERLRGEMLQLREGLARVEDGMDGPVPVERPPHY